jgi:threonine aldolase
LEGKTALIPIDLRSDTVTRPSPGMRAAIANAEVGDDVLGDDPTVLRLQQRAADLLGAEAALFVPSGTMANQLAIRCACEPGDEIICDDATHSFHYETGGPAALSGVGIRTLAGDRGIFTAEQAEAAIRPGDSHFPASRMVIIENTNNRGGGSVWPTERIRQVHELAASRGLHLHLDGARLMHAAAALGCPPAEIARHADSVSTCFSKGLGAPIGSVLAGSSAMIKRAHRFRKMFGGGMRQVGILAAAALYALDHNVERLAEDHTHARRLAEGLTGLPGINLAPASVETNIVIFSVIAGETAAAEFVQRLGERGVGMFTIGGDRVRAVTHLDVSADQIEQAIAIAAEILKG